MSLSNSHNDANNQENVEKVLNHERWKSLKSEATEIVKALQLGDVRDVFLMRVVDAYKKLSDSTLKIRLLSFFAEVASLSKESSELCEDLGWLDAILEIVEDGEDILEQLNGVMLIEQSCSNRHVFDYMMYQDLVVLFQDILNCDDYHLIAKGIETIGILTERWGERIFNEMNEVHVVDKIVSLFSVEELRENIITCIARLCCCKPGLTYLQTNSDALEILVGPDTVANEDLNLATLHSLSGLIIRYEPNSEEYLETLYKSLYEPTTTERLYNYISGPIENVRYAAYQLLYSIVHHNFGIKEISSYPGLPEILLNREHDGSKSGLEWKYKIINKVYTNESVAKEHLGVTLFHEFKTYVENGIFFAPAQTEQVAIQDLHL